MSSKWMVQLLKVKILPMGREVVETQVQECEQF